MDRTIVPAPARRGFHLAWLLAPALLVPPTPAVAVPPATFHPPTSQAIDINPRPLAIGDLNGDGALDVALAHPRLTDAGVPAIAILPGLRSMGQPIGRLGPAIKFFPDTGVPGYNVGNAIVAGQFVGADIDDIVFLTRDNSALTPQSLSTMSGSPAYAVPPVILTPIRPWLVDGPVVDMAPADFNEDGLMDLIVAYRTTPLQVALGLSSGGVASGEFGLVTARPLSEGNIARIIAADLDSDGHQDAAWTIESLGRIEVHRGRGDGHFDREPRVPTGGHPRHLAAVNLDGDGFLELVAATEGGVSVMRGMGTGTEGELLFGSPVLLSGGGSIASADWNLDGLQDLALANSGYILILLGRGNGTFDPPQIVSTGSSVSEVRAADMDANGTPDLVAQCAGAPPQVQVHLNAGVLNGDPDCSGATAVVPYAWPPTGDLEPVSITGITDPDGDPVTVTVTAVTQDEPVGFGSTCPDAAIADGAASIRHERSGAGDGRVYAIAFEATDGRGGACSGTVSVCVPHDLGRGATCVDDGQAYVSTESCRGGSGRLDDPEAAALPTVQVLANEVRFQFDRRQASAGAVTIYDVGGRRMASLDPGGGARVLSWDRRGAPLGLYFARFGAEGGARTMRFVLAR